MFCKKGRQNVKTNVRPDRTAPTCYRFPHVRPTSVLHFLLMASTTSCSSSSSFCESFGVVCTGIRTRSSTAGKDAETNGRKSNSTSSQEGKKRRRCAVHTCVWNAEAHDEGLSGEGVLISRLIVLVLVTSCERHFILSEIKKEAVGFVYLYPTKEGENV